MDNKEKVRNLQLLSIQEVAEILGVCEKTVKKLPIEKVMFGRSVRYTEAAVLEFIQKNSKA